MSVDRGCQRAQVPGQTFLILTADPTDLFTVRRILAFDLAAVIFTISGRYGAGDHNEVARMLGARRGFRKPARMEESMEAVQATLRGMWSGA